ncbi:MAG: hypothetical protein ACLUOK_09630 [Parabacteroides distasonis]
MVGGKEIKNVLTIKDGDEQISIRIQKEITDLELDRRCPNKKDVIRKAIKHYSSVVQWVILKFWLSNNNNLKVVPSQLFIVPLPTK